MSKPRKIRTTPAYPILGFNLGGWLHGKNTYVWFGVGDKCLGTLGGGKLYRLAKAIVRQFDSAGEEGK